MPGAPVDWTKPQFCVTCDVRMRPGGTTSQEMPDTLVHASHGECSSCQRRRKRAEAREAAKEAEVRYPTVRELYEQGHPCIEPCPKPKTVHRRKESRLTLTAGDIEQRWGLWR